MEIEVVRKHIRDREYMSGIERDKTRVKATGEIFTPTPLVQEILDQLPQELFTDPNKTFLDPTCGDGQFLGEILIRKMENGSTFEQALSTVYGVDLMQDNIDECRKRLLCGSTNQTHINIIEQNIYQADGLKFSYKFKPMSETRRKREDSSRAKAKGDREKRLKEEERKRVKEQKIKLIKKFFGQEL